MLFTRKTLATAIALPFFASGCIFYPTVTQYNDPKCNLDRHKLELKMKVLDGTGNPCGNMGGGDCAVGLLAIAGLTFAVSGTVVVAGNSAMCLENIGEVYWREKTGRCANSPITQASDTPVSVK